MNGRGVPKIEIEAADNGFIMRTDSELLIFRSINPLIKKVQETLSSAQKTSETSIHENPLSRSCKQTEKRTRNSEKLPLSSGGAQKVSCVFCGSKNTKKHSITRNESGIKRRRILCRNCCRTFSIERELEKIPCPKCNSKNTIKKGIYQDGASKRGRIQCKDCGAWSLTVMGKPPQHRVISAQKTGRAKRQTASVPCIYCQSKDTIRHGKRDGIEQRIMCKDCRRTFTIERSASLPEPKNTAEKERCEKNAEPELTSFRFKEAAGFDYANVRVEGYGNIRIHDYNGRYAVREKGKTEVIFVAKVDAKRLKSMDRATMEAAASSLVPTKKQILIEFIETMKDIAIGAFPVLRTNTKPNPDAGDLNAVVMEKFDRLEELGDLDD